MLLPNFTRAALKYVKGQRFSISGFCQTGKAKKTLFLITKYCCFIGYLYKVEDIFLIFELTSLFGEI